MPPTRRRYLERLGAAGGVAVASALAGCGENRAERESVTNVRVGSKPFAEQRILGYLAYHRLRDVDGVQAVDEIGYGTSSENWTATAAGVKDVYWEYTGTAWSRLPPRRAERVTDPRRLYERVAADARERGLRMAEPAPFSNEYVLVADRAWSDRTDVTTLSEFATHVADGRTSFGVAVNEDFYHRRDAWRGVLDHYGVSAGTQAELESGGFVVTSVGLTYELVANGDASVASGFATDPQLERESLVVLDDDRTYFLPYQPSPTAHAQTVAANPDVFDALAPVAASLDEATMRRLNRRVLVDGEPPSAVAASHLSGV
ncbi:ABC transporter substrate-binding protein [Halobacterium litoreum]|uniref:Glycine betaine ABC transporter substrate-binding protein n=1 Tax=Halobacterium litoreum TaxID=2039234 RepID=A0ABD5NCV0_9EURY|nr:glycine betaine ABC transporter substrate-binding protein [Halobacterium litoreum]UHH14195.1 hypothetical protein LT972_04140 [Halobacterium litoreum]